jgi:lipopolysaccharide export system protein LptC
MKNVVNKSLRLLLATFLVALSCSNQDGSVKNLGGVDTVTRPDTELKGTTINLYDKDQVTSKVHAQRILKYESKDSTMGYVVNATFYDSTGAANATLTGDSALIKENSNRQSVYGHVLITGFDAAGKPTGTLTGDSAVVSGKINHMYVYGQVVATTDTGNRLETDYLHWNPEINKFQTDAFVRITRPNNDLLTGWGMEADRRLTRIKILKQVSGSFRQTDSVDIQ